MVRANWSSSLQPQQRAPELILLSKAPLLRHLQYTSQPHPLHRRRLSDVASIPQSGSLSIKDGTDCDRFVASTSSLSARCATTTTRSSRSSRSSGHDVNSHNLSHLSRTILGQLSSHSRACRLSTSGRPFAAGSRGEYIFEHGLGTFSLRDLYGHPMSVHVAHRDGVARIGDHGLNHVIVPATLVRDATIADLTDGASSRDAAAAASAESPVALRIQKARHSRCDTFWEVPDVLITLGGAPAWPALLAAGCCEYATSMASDSVTATAATRTYLFVTVRPLRRPVSIRPGFAVNISHCQSLALSDRLCALNLLRTSLSAFHELLEAPLRVRLREHYLTSYPNGTAAHRFKLGQLCQSTYDGALAVCDVGHVVWDPSLPSPRSQTATEWVREWVRAPINSASRLEIRVALADPLHFLLQTLGASRETRAAFDMVPELWALAQEVEAQHHRIEKGCAGAEQMSFACAAQRLLSLPQGRESGLPPSPLV